MKISNTPYLAHKDLKGVQNDCRQFATANLTTTTTTTQQPRLNCSNEYLKGATKP